MPIPLACACGKQLRVGDEFAGKTIRCPACQNILTVPGAAPAAPPAPKPALAKPVPAKVSPTQPEPDEPPAPAVRAPGRRPAPAGPPQSSSRWWLWLLLGLGGLGLVGCLGCVGVVWWLWPADPENVIIGRWELDKEATKKINPLMAAFPGTMTFEFQKDGTFLSGGDGEGTRKGAWKVVEKKGRILTLEITQPNRAQAERVEIQALSNNSIVYNPVLGLGGFQLKRVGSVSASGGDGKGAKKDEAKVLQARLSIDCKNDGDTLVGGVAISDDGKVAATYSSGPDQAEHVKVWDLTNSTKIKGLRNPSGGWLPVALSPDGSKVVTASMFGGGVLVHDVRGGNKPMSLVAKEDPALATDLFYCGPQKTVVLGGSRCLVGWDAATGQVRFSLVEGPDELKSATPLFADGRRIAAGYKGLIRVWDTQTGKVEKAIPAGKESLISLVVTKDGQRLAAAEIFGPIKVYDRVNGNVIHTIPGNDLPARVDGMAFLPDNKTLMYPVRGGHIVAVNVETGARRAELRGHTKTVYALDVTPDGRTLVSGAEDGTLKVWDLNELP